MSLEEILKISFSTAAAILASVGGESVIIVGLSAWISKVWAERIYLKNSSSHNKDLEEIKKDYAIELEHLKSEISQHRDLMSISQNALLSGYNSSRERTLIAIENLWKKILEIKEIVSDFIYFYSVLQPSEYSKAVSEETSLNLIHVKPEEFDAKVLQVSKGVDELRLFVGESLYRLYYIYRAFAFRQALKILRRKDENVVYEWDKNFDGKEDTALYQILKEIFTEEELQSIIRKSLPCAPVPGILDAIELKIISEMKEYIFGRQLVNRSIEEQLRISKLLQTFSEKDLYRQIDQLSRRKNRIPQRNQ